MDGELILHVTVTLTGSAGIGDIVKAFIQAEALTEAWNIALTGHTVQNTGDEDPLFRALIGICNGKFRLFIGNLPDDSNTVLYSLGGDKALRLGIPGFHKIAEHQVGVIVCCGAVQKSLFFL